MDKSNTLTILKNAFLIERKGKSLYEKARDHAKDDSVKAFFNDLAIDEQEHMNILEKQFKAFMKDGKFMAGGFENDASLAHAPDILDQTLKDKIDAAADEATSKQELITAQQKALTAKAKGDIHHRKLNPISFRIKN